MSSQQNVDIDSISSWIWTIPRAYGSAYECHTTLQTYNLVYRSHIADHKFNMVAEKGMFVHMPLKRAKKASTCPPLQLDL